MSLPSIVSYGSGAKTSTLVWDSDLTIPDGYAIESASGEVGIIGDVSVSGTLSAENTVQGVQEVESALITATNANITTPMLNGKNMVNILIPLATPISTTSSAKSFTVNNPYSAPVKGSISCTASSSNHVSNDVRLDGNIVFYVNPNMTRTVDLILTPGNHTISQDYSGTITVSGNYLSFYAFN